MKSIPSSSDPLAVRYLRSKEIDDSLKVHYQMRLSSMKSLIDRLGLHCELNSGYENEFRRSVNCVEWNQEGTILASGLANSHVMLWDPFRKKRLADINTEIKHYGVHSVKFMPQSKDGMIASAGGNIINIDWVEKQSSVIPQQPRVFQCSCHFGDVKGIAVAPDVPNLLWSGASDGTIKQFDLRTPHSCANGPFHILINLMSHIGDRAHVNSIAINPLRTEQLAVGANDLYVRLYDRRMIKMTSVQFSAHLSRGFLALNSRDDESRSAIPLGCVQYFAPGSAHVPKMKYLDVNLHRISSMESTNITFDPSGRHLLAIQNGALYLYDCNSPSTPVTKPPILGHGLSNDGLSSTVEQLKLQADAAFLKQQYPTAIGLYSKALLKAPHLPVLYSNRAAACMKRNWDGDVYAALKDCSSALRLDAGQLKAFHRLIQCFINLGLLTSATQALTMLKEAFPAQVGISSVRKYELEIEKELLSQQREQQLRQAKKDKYEKLGLKMDFSFQSTQETHWRLQYWDYVSRFVEGSERFVDANFFGQDGQYIVAGATNAGFYIFNRQMGIVERCLDGDDFSVNSIKPHPFTCLLASCGNDSVVRLWSPLPHDGSNNGSKDRVFGLGVYTAAVSRSRSPFGDDDIE